MADNTGQATRAQILDEMKKTNDDMQAKLQQVGAALQQMQTDGSNMVRIVAVEFKNIETIKKDVDGQKAILTKIIQEQKEWVAYIAKEIESIRKIIESDPKQSAAQQNALNYSISELDKSKQMLDWANPVLVLVNNMSQESDKLAAGFANIESSVGNFDKGVHEDRKSIEKSLEDIKNSKYKEAAEAMRKTANSIRTREDSLKKISTVTDSFSTEIQNFIKSFDAYKPRITQVIAGLQSMGAKK